MPDQNQTNPAQDQSATTTPPVPSVTDQPKTPVETTMPDFQSAMTDIPPMPEDTSTTLATEPTETVGSAAPTDLPPVTPPMPKKKFGGGKFIATILGVLLLVGGVGAGIFLTQQQQDIREKAGVDTGMSDLTGNTEGRNVQYRDTDGDGRITESDVQAPETQLPPGYNGLTVDQLQTKCGEDGASWDGSRSACTYPEGFSPLNPPSAYYDLNNSTCGRDLVPGAPACCSTSIKASCGGGGGSEIVCEQGGRKECKTGSTHCTIEADSDSCGGTNTTTSEGGDNPTPTPASSASCQNIKAYSTTWTLLTPSQLSALEVGDQVNFCVLGVASEGVFDMARFTINGAVKPDTTTIRPGTTDFCQNYTVPAATTTFNVSAQIHHATLGWK